MTEYVPYPDGVELVTSDLGAGRWVEEALERAGFARGVRSVVPERFESYVRILHPASKRDRPTGVRWAEVAAWSGRRLDSTSTFDQLSTSEETAGPGDPPWDGRPEEGRLARKQIEALVEILAGWTETADRCWFCLWEGYGPLQRWGFGTGEEWTVDAPPPSRDAPTLRTPARRWKLLTGPIRSVPLFHDWLGGQPPNIWWPDDRQWCVASGIDLDSTYVGGAAPCISEILEDDRVEALPTTSDATLA